jgi:hypothetical protein
MRSEFVTNAKTNEIHTTKALMPLHNCDVFSYMRTMNMIEYTLQPLYRTSGVIFFIDYCTAIHDT